MDRLKPTVILAPPTALLPNSRPTEIYPYSIAISVSILIGMLILAFIFISIRQKPVFLGDKINSIDDIPYPESDRESERESEQTTRLETGGIRAIAYEDLEGQEQQNESTPNRQGIELNRIVSPVRRVENLSRSTKRENYRFHDDSESAHKDASLGHLQPARLQEFDQYSRFRSNSNTHIPPHIPPTDAPNSYHYEFRPGKPKSHDGSYARTEISEPGALGFGKVSVRDSGLHLGPEYDGSVVPPTNSEYRGAMTYDYE